MNNITKVKYLSDELQTRLLGRPRQPMPESVANVVEYNLSEAGMLDAEDYTEVVDLPLPEWLGTVTEFEADLVNSNAAVFGCLERLADLKANTPAGIPKGSGWYHYEALTEHSGQWVQEDSFKGTGSVVIDFETVRVTDADWRPVCCVVLTNGGHWWVWRVSTALSLNELPRCVEVGKRLVYIGHNVGYDLGYIAEEVSHQPSGSLALCTMGIHMVTRGVSNQQRWALELDPTHYDSPEWLTDTSKASLDEVYQLHYGVSLDKGVRDSIVELGWSWVRDNLDEVVFYCINDVYATHEVYQAQYPEFCDHVPDPVMRLGMMHQYMMYVPLSASRYPGYYERVETAYESTLKDIASAIIDAAQPVLALANSMRFVEVSLTESEPGERYYDKVTKQRKTKANPHPVIIEQRFKLIWVDGYEPTELDDIRRTQLDWKPLKSKKLGEVPTWYADLLDNPTAGRTISALVLGVTWLGSPVRYDRARGWMFRNSAGVIEPLPSPEKAGKPVHDIFCKGFMKDEDTVTPALGTADGSNTDLLMRVMSCSLWKSFRKRIRNIRTVDRAGYPVTKPAISRTVSGRCIDLWQLMPNPKMSRLGSGVRSLVEAPKGYRLVKADLASQELRAFSDLGDAHHGFYGSTPLGKSNLVGSSKRKTDPHSLLGILTGILNRTLLKNINYGTIYGLAEKGIADYIQKSAPDTIRAEAVRLAKLISGKLKGHVSEVSGWYLLGMASDSFNAVMKCYRQPSPRTPYGRFRMSKALSKAGWKQYQPTFQNWVIQSTGSVITTKLLAYTMHLFKRFRIPARLVLTVHDEFCYLTRSEFAESVVYIMQLAHLLLRADITLSLGLDGIPANYAYFDGIEVDTIFRKDPTAQPRTPDDPDIFIEPGKEYSPHEAAIAGRRLLVK